MWDSPLWQDKIFQEKPEIVCTQLLTPITLCEEWSGYATMLSEDLQRIDDALKGFEMKKRG